jgi:hypothetical protein
MTLEFAVFYVLLCMFLASATVAVWCLFWWLAHQPRHLARWLRIRHQTREGASNLPDHYDPQDWK